MEHNIEKIKKLESLDPSQIEDAKILIRVNGQHYALAPLEGFINQAQKARVEAVKELFKTHGVVGVPLEKLNPKKVLKNMTEQKKNKLGAYDPNKKDQLNQVQEFKRRYTALLRDVVADDWKDAMAKWRLDVYEFLSVPAHRKYKAELEEYTKTKIHLTDK